MKAKILSFDPMVSSPSPDERQPAFSKWRQKIWPIFSDELGLFLPLVSMMFWILWNATLTRNLKDNLLVYAPHSGAHVLPWVKVIWVTPLSILFVLAYAKLSNQLSRRQLFYATLTPFGLFFLAFPFVIYPLHAHLHVAPDTVWGWQQSAPWLADLCPVMGYWTFSLFYTVTEIWSNVAVALLFWQFANQVTPVSQAKRFYPLFGFWSNLGSISASGVLMGVEPILQIWGHATHLDPIVTEHPGFSVRLRFLCGLVVLGCGMLALCYGWANQSVLSRTLQGKGCASEINTMPPKLVLPVKESLRFLAQSRQLRLILILVLACGIAVNLVDTSWKDAIKAHYGKDRLGFSRFQGLQALLTSMFTMVLILCSQGVVRAFGWRLATIVTPWVSLVTGGLFFLFLIFQDHSWITAWADPMAVAMWLGLTQNCLTRGAKHSFFDPTKEMAYISLDEESKVKGKAVIDVLGGRMARAGGSILDMTTRALAGKGTPFFLAIASAMVGICVWWMWAVRTLWPGQTPFQVQDCDASHSPQDTTKKGR